MDDIIAELQKVYGNNWPYEKLTDQQRALLLDADIKGNLDALDSCTVSVGNITEDDGAPVLTLQDIWIGAPGNRMGTGEYAFQRLQAFKRILGVDPECIECKCFAYELLLEERAKVKVSFYVDMDRD